MTNHIIEQKDDQLPIIDGESYIAVLSDKLHLLDIRMKSMLEKLQEEQHHLQMYIEDISHQIKTPLTAMFLKEDLLLEICDGTSYHYVEQLVIQTQKIQDFIESLLNLAKVDNHTIIYRKKEYDFEEILSSIEDHLQPLLEKHDVSLNYHDVNQIIYCDFQWMKEALENIIKNCIEQKDHDSIDISCHTYSSYIEIRIQDHGQGFHQKDIPHLFERFYQSQFQQKNHGIGIGLSMTQGIILDHFGTIQALQNNGALFIIQLPLKNTKSKYKSH